VRLFDLFLQHGHEFFDRIRALFQSPFFPMIELDFEDLFDALAPQLDRYTKEKVLNTVFAL
jgi:hypothetical protein